MTPRFALAFCFSLLMVLTACNGSAAQDTTTSSADVSTTTGAPTPSTTSVPTTDTPPTSSTAQSPTGTEKFCTEIGCDSVLTIELASVGVQPDQTYDIEICVDDGCRTETITIDVPHPGTGETIRGESKRAPGSLDGWMLLWADSDSVDYYLPEGDYGESAQVSFTLTDASGEVLAEVENQDVTLERSQPNGPDCPPVCFQGHLTI